MRIEHCRRLSVVGDKERVREKRALADQDRGSGTSLRLVVIVVRGAARREQWSALILALVFGSTGIYQRSVVEVAVWA